MRISRFYCPERLHANNVLNLDKESSHYIKNVLRHKSGDELIVFNPEDGEFSAVIKQIDKLTIQINILDKIRTNEPPKVNIHLGQGIARGEKMDFIVQKATELGVSTITPLFTEHCNVKISADRSEKRVVHWQRIAINASEQCGRISVPEILEPQKLINWLSERDEEVKLVCHQTETRLEVQNEPKVVVLLIGPEGGLSEYERELAYQVGFQNLGLGPRILRTETASLTALSVLQYRYGDL